MRKEFLRDDGGGDLSLGDRGHVGVFSPEPVVAAWTLETLGSLDVVVVVEDGSEVGGVGSCGVVAAERARCMAAAEGIVPLWAVVLGGLCGLTSCESFRDRMPDDAAPDVVCCLKGRPAGEESRDDRGEAAAEEDRETASEWVPGKVPVDLLLVGMVGRVVVWGPVFGLLLLLSSASQPREPMVARLSVIVTFSAAAV